MQQAIYDERIKTKSGDPAYFGLGCDFADLFAAKGWNLYEVDGPVCDLEEMEDLIRQGRSWPVREDQRYILLPRVVNPDSPPQVLAALKNTPARYPFFIDEYEKVVDGLPVVINRGHYLIESVMLTREQVLILVDIDAMLMLDIPIAREIAGMHIPCICFDVLEMYERLGQVSSSLRHSFLAA